MNGKERPTNHTIVYGIVISAIFVASLLLASNIISQFQSKALAVNNVDNATATNQTATTASTDTTGGLTNKTNIQTNTTSSTTTSRNRVSIVEDASEMGDNAFDPNPINIKVGDTVTWINDDVATHTVTSDSDEDNNTKSTNGETFDSGFLSQGQTFEHTFKKAGNYGYFCTLHPSMTGEVKVKKG